jgi:hypothetical protein
VCDPCIGRAKRRAYQPTSSDAPHSAHIRQPRTFEHAHMFRDTGQRHVEERGQLADGALATG